MRKGGLRTVPRLWIRDQLIMQMVLDMIPEPCQRELSLTTESVCMKELRIRNVDDWVVEWHRTQAKRDGKSLECELREILTASALASKRALADELRAGLDEFRS